MIKILTVILSLCLGFICLQPLSAQEDSSQTNDDIDMIVGDIQTVDVNKLNRVSVNNPDIADISDAQNDKVSLLAKKPGDAVLFLWDAAGKRSLKIKVLREDLSSLQARLQKLLQEANIQGVTLEQNADIGRVVLAGAVTKDNKNRLESLMQPYTESILNLVKEEKSEDLIQVDMQIVEIQTSYEKDLGVQWSPSATAGTGNTSSNANSGLITESENLPASNGNGKFGDFFKVGGFARTGLQATVNAFIQEGKARLISKPRLVVMSGKQASFLVGGEIPIETTTTNTTGSTLTQNTSYTQYGVNVTVTPTLREGKIDVLLNVDIRDIDAANSSNGNVAFITRTASTNLFMDDKQTIVLAGLIKYTDNDQLTRVPFLSNIPIVGLLFRNHNTPTPDTNTEMVIILTPAVLSDKRFSHEQVVMPTDAETKAWVQVTSKYAREPITAEAAKPADVSEAVLPVMTAYARMVQEKISRSIYYPQDPSGALTGTVKLKLHILKDGSLDSEEIIESSGSNVLDQDAVQAAKTAAPFDTFTTGMDQQDMFFTIPIVYNKVTQAPAEKVVASY